MKKLTLVILVILGTFSMASAEIGVKVGISGQLGILEGSGSELATETSVRTQSATEETIFGTASIFIEKDLSFIPIPLVNRLSIGYDIDQTPTRKLSANNVQNANGDLGSSTGTNHGFTNSVSAEVEGFNTLYVKLRLTDWLYVKSGSMEMDIKTTENMGSGGVYGDASIDGTTYGVGVHSQNDDNGLFFTAEWNSYDFDGASVTSTGTNSNRTITLDGVEGTAVKLSIGKAF